MPKLARRWWTLAVACTGIFMLLLDINGVNIALPDLAGSLHATFSDLKWVIDAYALSLAALLLIAGSLGDLAGARRVFLAGLAVFCASSLSCGLAQSPGFLIASRAAQGVGGAAMFATSLALLAHQFRGRDRGVALSAWGAIAGGAVAVGPLVGGALAAGISWRWIFLINVPIGALTFAATLARVREAATIAGTRPDWAGFVTLAGGMFAGVYGLIRGNLEGWSSPGILASFACCGALVAGFGLVEHWQRERQPMLPLRLFRNPALAGASLGALVISATIFSVLLYLILYLQEILQYSAFQTGLRFLPLTVPMTLVAPLSGRLSAHVPQRLLIGVGLALIALGLGLMTVVSATSGWTVLLAGMITAGAGSGLTNPALTSAAVGTVSRDRAGVGSGINNTFRQLGIAVGIAGLGAIFAARVRAVFVHDLAARAPRLAPRAGKLADTLTSGTGLTGTRPGGPAGHEIALAAHSAFAAGLDRICWVAAFTAAGGAILTAALVRTRCIASAPEAPAEQEEAMRRAAPPPRRRQPPGTINRLTVGPARNQLIANGKGSRSRPAGYFPRSGPGSHPPCAPPGQPRSRCGDPLARCPDAGRESRRSGSSFPSQYRGAPASPRGRGDQRPGREDARPGCQVNSGGPAGNKTNRTRGLTTMA